MYILVIEVVFALFQVYLRLYLPNKYTLLGLKLERENMPSISQPLKAEGRIEKSQLIL